MLRALLAAFLVAAVAFAGAAYVSSRTGSARADVPLVSAGMLPSLNLQYLGTQATNSELVSLAFSQVEHVYYKPVAAQTLINGERNGLLAYLKDALKRRNVRPQLPAVTATSDSAQVLRALNGELAYAQTHYGRTLGSGSSSDLTQAALTGMLAALGDPYTVYLSPQQIGALNEQLNGGDFGGIGVFIYQLKSGDALLQPIPDLPAARAGMHGDEIVQRIDGQAIHGFSLDRIDRMIRGPQGTTVRLTTHPYKKTTVHTYTIKREIIHVPTVHAKMEDGFDYMSLSDFGETSAAEIHKALLYGKAHRAKGYILDLRGNGGGLLDAAVDISSYFIPKGPIVTEIDRNGTRDVQDANGSYIPGLTPLAVLVNGFTASASEITAGALQDYKLATLIGTKTYGKGVVQGIFKMPNGGALKITTERYVTPSGRSIQHKGIQPNITVPQSPDVNILDTPADKQLKAAKAFLSHLGR